MIRTLKKQDLRSRKFWLNLKKNLGYSGICRGLCARVAKEFLERLPKDSGYEPRCFSKDIVSISEGNGIAEYHVWLQKDNGNDIFIADATAGQLYNPLEPEFNKISNGFYGSIDDAPKKLREMYWRGYPAHLLLNLIR